MHNEQFIGVRRSDGAAIGHAGSPHLGFFPKFFDTKAGVTNSCGQQVKYYKRYNGKCQWYPHNKSLLPGDEVDVFQITFTLQNGMPQTTGFTLVGTLIFDPQKIGMRWL